MDTQAPRLIVDEMLMRLGRWLRAAGYDTLMFPPGTPDARLIHLARKKRRWLITRDRKLLEYRDAPSFVICLNANSLDACAMELAERLDINWLLAPFSRCMVCNQPLIEADDAARERVPERSRRHSDHISQCPGCGRIYWNGSHCRRMLAKLSRWQEKNRKPSCPD